MTLFQLGAKLRKTYPNLDKNELKLALMHVYMLETYSDYILKQHDEIKIKPQVNTIVNRLLEGEPLQYILGYAYFYNRNFKVNRYVLIPRPETEELVAMVDKEVTSGTVVDIGTGSGVIAVTLSANPALKVYGSDICRHALKVASTNDTEKKVTFLYGDLLTPYIEEKIKVDVLVANLPYIKADEVLDNKVKSFEPKKALYLPKVNIFKRLFESVSSLLIGDNGLSVYLEIGTDQAGEVTTLAREILGESVTIKVVKDLQGKERFIVIKGIYGNNNI